MKKNMLLLVIVFLISGHLSLNAQTRDVREVGSFTKVDFKLPGKLYLKQGSTHKVEIEASKDMLSKIEAKVEGSKLILHVPSSWSDWNWKNDGDIKVYVTITKLEGLYASGSGDIIGESKFNTDDADLKVSGSGSMKVEITASGEMEADVSGSGDLTVKGSARSFDADVSGSGKVYMDMNIAGKSDFGISGSGKIEASGKTESVVISISGSGKVYGANFETVRCDVKISGSGDVEINVKEELESHISGSGTVSYKGNPSKVHNNASGSGSVRKM